MKDRQFFGQSGKLTFEVARSSDGSISDIRRDMYDTPHYLRARFKSSCSSFARVAPAGLDREGGVSKEQSGTASVT